MRGVQGRQLAAARLPSESQPSKEIGNLANVREGCLAQAVRTELIERAAWSEAGSLETD
jgi:hypothetical protein